MGYRPLSDATLMGMTKKVIIEMLRIAEHNFFAAEVTHSHSAENLKDWAPVVHGCWIHYDGVVICNECGDAETSESCYCKQCGAKMDGKGEEA